MFPEGIMGPFDLEHLKKQAASELEGKIKFELKFNASRGIGRPFSVWIYYDQVQEVPYRMVFKDFENPTQLHKALGCKHNCVQPVKIRYYIKNVPPGIQPFSLRLWVCPDCGAPMTYQYIVYPGGVDKYPKMRDLGKFKDSKPLPRALERQEQKIEVA